MMEILFRGKRIDTGEWVYGDFYRKCGITGIVHDYMISTRDGMEYPVIPETIGQYIGLDDKSGVKIFEGDFVKVKDGLRFGDQYECVGTILVEDIRSIGPGDYYEMEVVGNIHEDPEVME